MGTCSIVHECRYHRVKNTRHGTMLYSTHDIYIGRSLDSYGEWAWDEIELTRPYARGLVIDVGSNVGTHALSYAETADHVLAVEPQYRVYQMLAANVMLNCKENIQSHFGALGDYDGHIRLPVPDYSHTNNFGGVAMGDGDSTVNINRIDSFQASPQFIKIDVEGRELEVLQGARETIMRSRPVLYVENDRLDKAKSLIDLIESLGYTYKWHIPRLYNPHNFYGYKENLFPGISSVNMLCLPN
jgi:FkbM family methyltransferase